jgi:putative ABC transport system ATP-binding protein
VAPEMATVSGPLFDLQDVTFSRAGRPVLQGLSAHLPAGASAIVGPSGCGKSSLLRLLNRLADPDSGAVRYRGRSVAEYDPLALRREVCLVPQLPALLEGTVEDNVLYAARLAHSEPDLARLLDLAGLDPSFGPRDADLLSVGEQQRVMLARALALEPTVLLLDEPTSALDDAAREAIERSLIRLRERLDVSLVVVTHDLDQAQRLGDSLLRIDHGRAANGAGALP